MSRREPKSNFLSVKFRIWSGSPELLMFERFERELLPKEKRLLLQKISGLRARRRKSWFTFLVVWFGLSALSSLAILFDKATGGEIPRHLKGWAVLGMFC